MTKHKRSWTKAEVDAWFAGRIPDGWFTEPPSVSTDREEILVVGALAPPSMPADADADSVTVAERARIAGFREDTRAKRMRIADEAEVLWGRKVSWGARVGGTEELFTTQSVPVMTRLRMPERAVLDTLIDAGVARSRSEALAWCVRLVGEHESEWIAQLRDAVENVERVRNSGPASTEGDTPKD